MITRKNIIDYEVNEHEANELYLEEDILEDTNGGDINSILDMMYRRNGISPLSLIWELTDKCNFNCPFCYIHNHSDSSDKDDLTYRFETMKHELDELIDRGLFICYLSGGECLLHPDFEKIYLYLKKKGVLVAVLTNASLISEDHLKLFKEYKPYKVEVSIYGVKHTFSNDSSAADKVLENVLNLKNAGVHVIAKMPYNKCTETEFEDVKAWCELNEIDFFYSDELFNGYDGTDNSAYKRIEVGDKNREEVAVFGYKRNFDCPAGKHSFLLSYNKKLKPCFAFYEQKAPDWNVDIEKGGICEAFDQLKRKIECVSGKRLKYCNGCENSKQCFECIATQSIAEDLERYMKSVCSRD